AAWPDFVIGAVTLAILVALPRRTRRIPAPLLALPAAAILALAIEHWVPGVSIATVARRFQVTVGNAVYHGVPPLPPQPLLPWTAPGPDGQPLVLSLSLL